MILAKYIQLLLFLKSRRKDQVQGYYIAFHWKHLMKSDLSPSKISRHHSGNLFYSMITQIWMRLERHFIWPKRVRLIEKEVYSRKLNNLFMMFYHCKEKKSCLQTHLFIISGGCWRFHAVSVQFFLSFHLYFVSCNETPNRFSFLLRKRVVPDKSTMA